MCLHPRNNIARDFAPLELSDLSKFDTCDYIHSVKNVDVDDLIVLQLNIRGLLNKISLLTNLLSSCVENRAPDVVLLSETWLTPTSPSIDVDGYNFVHCCRSQKRGGGVGILISKSLRYTECKKITSAVVENECVTVELKLRSQATCIISSMYRPPNVDIQTFQTCYNSLVCEMKKLRPKSIVIGLDHNLDFLKSDCHKGTEQFIQHNLDANLIPTITRPTRITRSSATLIDNILVSQSLCGNYDSGILIDDISDHMPSICVIKSIKGVGKDVIQITSRDTRPRNLNALRTHLINYDWIQLLASDVNTSMTKLHSILQDEIDHCIPETTRSLKRKQVRREVWITHILKKSIDKSKRLYHRVLKHPDDSELREHYLAYKNTLKKTLQAAKSIFYQDKCKEFRQNTKKLWQVINKISGKSNDKTSSIDCLSIDGIREYSGKTIVNTMAKYFASVGRTFADKIPKPTQSVEKYLELLQSNNNSLFFSPCTEEEIRKLITELPSKHSSGVDNISNVLLQELAGSLCKPLCLITNSSMQSGVFPDLMKLAQVIPLYKGKSREFETNYRPISLLTTMSKIVEKIVYTRVYKFLTSTGQISESQYGFRSNHSCEHAVAHVIGSILKNLENKKSTISVMLDLSKAFDTIEHSIMLQKLELFGVRGVCLKWFKSYLENRHMRVKCKITTSQSSVVSEYYTVNYGTPQGSCLGPLIFLIFVNDMQLHLTEVESVQFADDTTILFSHRNEIYLQFCIERELSVLSDWFRANKLTLNVDKSVFLLFNRSGQKQINQLKLGEELIVRVANTKFLGTWIDDHLNWKTHMSKLLGKLKCGLGMLQRSNGLLTKRAKKLLYFGQIHSHLCYGLGVWGPMLTNSQITDLNAVQRKCIKQIDNTTPVDEAYKRLKILTVRQLIELEQRKLGYKLCMGLLPTAITQIMMSDANRRPMTKTHEYETRQKHVPNRPRVKSKLYMDSFLYKSIASYSNMPQELRNVTSLSTFVRLSKKNLLGA